MPATVGSPLLWTSFGVLILGMLFLDLAVFHRHAHQVRYQEALLWTLVWVSLAVVFNGAIYLRFGRQRGLEFLTGYLIEYALSVDNIFVFLLIFQYFAVPASFQHRVLSWGILGALITRLTFIFLGTTLLFRFEWLAFLFGVFLIGAGIKMISEQEVVVNPERNLILRIFRRFVPMVSENSGAKLLLRRDGVFYATPLLAVLVVVEATDVAFATDSIPAIFAITRDPFVIYTSNVFAILGLRSIYFLLLRAMSEFKYLKWGLGFVLVFVGIKMLVSEYWEIPIGTSLAVVGVLLAGSILVSMGRKVA